MRSVVFAFFLVPALAMAQVPAKLGFQGRLIKSDGTPELGVVSIVFSVYSAETGGTVLWTETQQIALSDGFYATFLGDVAPILPTVFNGAERFLELTIGGTALTPRMRINSVAYALMANDARNVVGGAVDASSIKVGGTTVIDSTGTLVGSAAYGATTGGGLTLDANSDFGLLTSCSAGQVLSWNGATWACSTITAGGSYSVAANGGLALTGTAFSLLTTCTAGQILKATSPGVWACAADAGTTYTAGAGLSLVGSAFTVNFLGTGVATTASRSDHNHDTAYYTQATLNTAGAINTATNPVDWTRLKNVPAGFADGVDADTLYTAGVNGGLLLTGTAFSLLNTCTAGQVLKATGLGVWACGADTSGVTSVTATAPMASTGGAAPNLSMTQANATTNGWLSAADWKSFGAGTGTNLIAWSEDTSKWTFVGGTAATITANTADVREGASSFDIAVSTGATGTWHSYGDFIPIDPTRRYRGRISARLITGAGTFYAGYIAYNAAKTVLSGNGGTYGYFIANGVTVPAGWTTYDGVISGEGAALNQFPVGTRFIKPLVITNYVNIGTTRIDSFEIAENNGAFFVETRDPRAGCPGAYTANTNMITHSFALDRPSIVRVAANMIACTSGRHDLYILVDGVERDRTLASPNGAGGDCWVGMNVDSVMSLGPGTHTVALRGTATNTYGCGGTWGHISSLIME